VNIEVMRTFVRLRQMLASDAGLSLRLKRGGSPTVREGLGKFKLVFDAIRQLMSPPLANRKQIGFGPRSGKK
jgi:hypothetical protein